MIWNTTPISASVTDNLNSVIMKVLGKQSDTTTKANYKNASVTAKLNYLEDEMTNLKTKVEVNGGVPRRLDYGHLQGTGVKSFTGPGRLVLRGDSIPWDFTVDGINFTRNAHAELSSSCFYIGSGNGYDIPFQSSLTIIGQGYPDYDAYYILYEY